MIAAAFLVLLRPYSIQCALLLLLLMLGTIATISFLFCWHRKLQKGRHPMKTVFSYRPRSRDALLRSHHFRSEVTESLHHSMSWSVPTSPALRVTTSYISIA